MIDKDENVLDQAIKQVKNKAIDDYPLEKLTDQVLEYTTSHKVSRFNFKHIALQVMRYAAILTVCTVLLGYGYFTAGGSDANLVWGDVVKNITTIDSVHIYQYDYKRAFLASSRQGWGWFSGGKICFINEDGEITIDDGDKKNYYNNSGEYLRENDTEFTRIDEYSGGQNHIFDILVKGIFGYDDMQIAKVKPSDVGQDFLVYEFEATTQPDEIQSVSVLVGKGSQLPVQVKVTSTDESYTLIILDYQQMSMPSKIKNLMGYSENAESEIK